MRLTFVQLRTYVADARRLGLTDEDQRGLENALLAHPAAGNVTAGTGGLRKLRHAPRARGGGKAAEFASATPISPLSPTCTSWSLSERTSSRT